MEMVGVADNFGIQECVGVMFVLLWSARRTLKLSLGPEYKDARSEHSTYSGDGSCLESATL